MKHNVFSEQLVGNKVESGPEPDEIELSVFGPGYGESVLFHVGGNNWFIVDSCIDPASGEPAPLSYLRNIKVNPSESVKQIIATHWHDDHVREMGIKLRPVQPSPGQVRIRGKRQNDTFSWKVSLFGEATPLANLYLL